MIPAAALLKQDFVIEEQPTHTYRLDSVNRKMKGYTDGREAMEQAVYKILSTERYRYVMYSWNYGIELLDLYGEPVSYVCPELERRITEALTWDKRIKSVDSFEFDTSKKGEIRVNCIAHTIFGEVAVEKEVKI